MKRNFTIKVLHEELRLRRRKQLNLLPHALHRQPPSFIPHNHLEIVPSLIAILTGILVIDALINRNHVLQTLLQQQLLQHHDKSELLIERTHRYLLGLVERLNNLVSMRLRVQHLTNHQRRRKSTPSILASHTRKALRQSTRQRLKQTHIRDGEVFITMLRDEQRIRQHVRHLEPQQRLARVVPRRRKWTTRGIVLLQKRRELVEL